VFVVCYCFVCGVVYFGGVKKRCKKKGTHAGGRTQYPTIKSRVLCQMSYTGGLVVV